MSNKNFHCRTEQQPSDNKERILLFEWHAKHFKSWNETMFPVRLTSNMVTGMDTVTFHQVTGRLMLLRKFYEPKGVNLGQVAKALEEELPPSEKQLRKTLKEVSLKYKEFIRQREVFRVETSQGSNNLTTDNIFYHVLYGLLLHSDADRGQKLRRNHRGMLHHGLLELNVYEPIIRTLATIEEIRKQELIDLEEPYPPFWEQAELSTMSIEEVDGMLKDLGFGSTSNAD